MLGLGQENHQSTKIYLYIISGAFIVVQLIVLFEVLPDILETSSDLLDEEALNENIRFAFIIAIVLQLLITLYFSRTLDVLAGKKKEIMKLRPNSNEELEAIKKKEKFYLSISQFAIYLINGLLIWYFAVTIISPLYRLLGTF